jgi:hypothetical protein
VDPTAGLGLGRKEKERRYGNRTRTVQPVAILLLTGAVGAANYFKIMRTVELSLIDARRFIHPTRGHPTV